MGIYTANPVRTGIYQGIYRGLYPQTGDPLVFHALTHAGASGGVDASGATLLPFEGTDTLVATVAGLTEARTSTNYAPDHEGVWRSWGSGEAVREGFRQVENLLTYSEDGTHANWSTYNCTVVSGATDPLGGNTAFTITSTGTNSNWAQAAIYSVGDIKTQSVWIRRRTGSGSVVVFDGSNTPVALTITTAWQRFSHSSTVTTTSGFGDGFDVRLVSSGDAIDVWHPQAENAIGRSNTNPSEYVPTTSAASKKYFASTNPWEVTSNVATATATVTELTDIWTVGSPAHTNSLPYSKPDTTNWSLTEGSAGDLVTNGDFQTGDATGWTLATGWTVVDSGGGAYVARCDGVQTTANLRQNAISGLTTNTIYKVVYTVSNYSGGGSIRPTFSGGGAGTYRAANGTYTEYIDSGATTGDFVMQGVNNFAGDVDDVTIQPAVIESYTTGLTGAADTAVVLTDDDSGAIESIDYTVTIPNDSNTNVLRVWVKKDSDITRYPQVFMIFTGGTFQREGVVINTQTGATITRITVGTTDHEVRDAGDWWEVLVSIANNSTGNVSAQVILTPAINTNFLTSTNVAATGSVTIADPVELHLNASIASVRGSSPIMTDGSAASTVATSLSFSSDNHSDTEGGYYAEVATAADGSDISTVRVLSTKAATGTGSIIRLSADAVASQANTASLTAQNYAWTSLQELVLGVAYSSTSGNHAVTINSSTDASPATTFTGWTADATPKLLAFDGVPNTVFMRNIKRWSIADAQSLIDSEMSA